MGSAFSSLWQRFTSVPSGPRVLVIDDWLPDPRIGAGAPRALVFLRAVLAAGASLTLLPTDGDPNTRDARRLLPTARVARDYGRPGIRRFLDLQDKPFDLIVVSRPHNMAAFREAAGRMLGATPVIYDSEALFAEREALRRDVVGEDAEPGLAAREIAEEIALADGTRIVLTVNAQAAQAFAAAGHRDVRIVGYAVEPQPTPAPLARRDGFLFVGPTAGGASPNSDSVVWFVDHVLPEIRRTLARDVPFVLAGQQTSAEVGARAGRMRPLGPLADLTQVYSGARVFVAPTRFASGIPIKVYDAAAHGVPVVLTPLLAEQLGWRDEEEALVARWRSRVPQAAYQALVEQVFTRQISPLNAVSELVHFDVNYVKDNSHLG